MHGNMASVFGKSNRLGLKLFAVFGSGLRLGKKLIVNEFGISFILWNLVVREQLKNTLSIHCSMLTPSTHLQLYDKCYITFFCVLH